MVREDIVFRCLLLLGIKNICILFIWRVVFGNRISKLLEILVILFFDSLGLFVKVKLRFGFDCGRVEVFFLEILRFCSCR